MARKLRLEYAGACYHVINRGDYRRDLFSGKGAADSFLKCLFETAERFGWRLHAYVVMSNHFHLVLETPEPNLSDGMKWLQGTWARRFNGFGRHVGRPFQGRFKALHVEPGFSLAQVAHYIHLNPERAGIVPMDRLLEYRWSSLVRFMEKQRPGFLVASTILAESGGLKDTPTGWRNYLGYLALLAEEDAKLRKERFGRLSRGWMIGSDEFREALQNDLEAAAGAEQAFELAGTDRAGQRQVREQHWERQLQLVARALRVRLDQLPAQCSAPPKVDLAAAMKATCSVSNGWLAQRLAMGQPASVSQYVRRHRLSGKTDAVEFQRALSRVKS